MCKRDSCKSAKRSPPVRTAQPDGKISIRTGTNFHTYYNGIIGCAQAACRVVLPVARYHGMTALITDHTKEAYNGNNVHR